MKRDARASSEALALTAAFFGGACLSLQARFNGTLGEPLSEPLVAAVWSFGSGLALLVLTLVVPSLRRGAGRLVDAIRAGRLRWWECLGGVLGGAFVAVQTSTVAILGVAVFIVASVGGRALGGLLADHVGAGPKGRTPITPARALAGAFAVVGVGITVSGQHVPGGIAILPALAVIIAGVMTQFQQGLNGRVSARAGSSYATTLQNFLVGVIALVVFAGARVLLGFTQWQWPHDAPWWRGSVRRWASRSSGCRRGRRSTSACSCSGSWASWGSSSRRSSSTCSTRWRAKVSVCAPSSAWSSPLRRQPWLHAPVADGLLQTRVRELGEALVARVVGVQAVRADPLRVTGEREVEIQPRRT